jgi:galactokinase
MKEITIKTHGRVNLIGEHTDYNGGWVLPTSISQATDVNIKLRSDDIVTIRSSRDRSHEYKLKLESSKKSWSDYIEGVTYLLFLEGFKLQGMEIDIISNIPEGSGLSSSAALEIGLLKGINELFQFNLSKNDMAKLGQRVENEFVGARVGIMDQMAVSYCIPDTALFLDTENLSTEMIKLPSEAFDLVIINSGIKHQLSSENGYNQRRGECEEACQLLKIPSLRVLHKSKLNFESLPPVLKKRVRHVYGENHRVHNAIKALKAKDLETFGNLLYQSHFSLSKNYEVSIPEIDFLIDEFKNYNQIFGARMTGGGFGGSVIAIAKKGTGKNLAEEIVTRYWNQFKIEAKIIS